MRLRSLTTAVALGLGAASLAAPPSHAFSSKAINVADLIRQSDQIVAGTVTKVEQGRDERGLPFTEIELKVAESIRGNASGTMKFRQFGLQTPETAVLGRKFAGLVAGMPQYAKDQQVVLFLTRTSAIGFRSTIGLDQGRFVLRGHNFENGNNNSALFSGVDFTGITLDAKEQSMVATQQGSLDADTFLHVVRRAVNETWWSAPTVPKPPRKGAGGSIKKTPQSSPVVGVTK